MDEKEKIYERVDMRQAPYRKWIEEMGRCNSLCWRIGQTEPGTPRLRALLEDLLPGLPEDSNILPPMQIDIARLVRVGRHTFINHSLTVMARGGVEIGDGVMIGPHVSLLTANHDFDDHMVLLCGKIRIQNNAWIGANASILAGVTVGENAVVAAGAVVTRDVPANTVVGGNPARVLKQLRTPDRVELD